MLSPFYVVVLHFLPLPLLAARVANLKIKTKNWRYLRKNTLETYFSKISTFLFGLLAHIATPM